MSIMLGAGPPVEECVNQLAGRPATSRRRGRGRLGALAELLLPPARALFNVGAAPPEHSRNVELSNRLGGSEGMEIAGSAVVVVGGPRATPWPSGSGSFP